MLLDIVGGSHWELGYGTVLRRRTEGNRGRQVAAELPKEAECRGQEMGGTLAFMEKYWNTKKSGPSSCMEVQAFSDIERLVF